MTGVTIRVEAWNGRMGFARSPKAAIKKAVQLWEADPAHPGRPGVNFYVEDECVWSERSLVKLKGLLR